MPITPSFGTFLPGPLNGCNSPSPYGAQDAYGVNYPTGVVPRRIIQVTFAEAQALDAPPPSIQQCYEGLYQWVQVDSGAVQAEVNTGLAAYYRFDVALGPIRTVTSESSAANTDLFAGVFLNQITLGNYGFIFSGQGRVNVTYKSSLGTAGAIGNTVVCGGGAGTFDGGSATAMLAKTVGKQVVAAAGGGTSAIIINTDYSISAS